MDLGTFFEQKKNLLHSDALHEYILETNVYPREHEQLRLLRQVSTEHPGGYMTVPPEEGQLLSLLLKLVKAKKAMEIGVFMGYSLLSALALPKDGKVIAIDPDREAFEKGLPYIKKANVESKIDFIHSKALPVLDEMLGEEKKEEGTFDFAFVDADKMSYGEYHERLMRLVKVGGLIAYDNTLWYGTVAEPDNAGLPEFVSKVREYLVKFNELLASDSRVEVSQLCIGDGLTLCRRTC